jgi:hypothetical protein
MFAEAFFDTNVLVYAVCSRSSESKTNLAFGRPISVGTSIVHGRCQDSEQYECQLFMGQDLNTSSRASGLSNEGCFRFIQVCD